MMIARPTVAEERWLVLAQRHRALATRIEQSGHGGVWKTTTWLARCLGFVLGLVATSLFAGLIWPLPAPWLIAGLVMMTVAEWLVAQRRVLNSGFEELIYLCGSIAVIVQLLLWNRHGGHEELGIAAVSAGVLVVGWRLLNPLFVSLAAVGFSLAVAASSGSVFGGGLRELEAGVFCAALALLALWAGGREWQRPSYDRMWDWLVIVMPWVGYLWLAIWSANAAASRTNLALAMALGFFALLAITGIRRRTHAPLIGALGLLVCTAWALRQVVIWPLHWQLIVAGGVLLAVAIIVDRMLRARTEGLTSRPLGDTRAFDLAQVAAAAHLAPRPGEAPVPEVQGQGGGFGGGGASGRF